jgi:hypothetical protein
MEMEMGPAILADRPPFFIEYLRYRISKMKKQMLGDPTIQAILPELEELERNAGTVSNE